MDAVFDLNCAKSCVSQCWFLYYGQNNGLFYFCPLNPPKHLRFLKIRTVMIILCFGNLSLPSQPSKKTVTSLDLQHHGSYLFLHHTDNLLIRHSQGKKHSFYKLLTFTLEKWSGLQLFLKSFGLGELFFANLANCLVKVRMNLLHCICINLLSTCICLDVHIHCFHSSMRSLLSVDVIPLKDDLRCHIAWFKKHDSII